MADRCYLEKCRDRLYPEFVLGGMTSRETFNGKEEVIYRSAEELLQKTPDFYRHIARPRLDEKFYDVASHIKNYFDGQNLYQEEIDRNLQHLDTMIKEDDFRYLRRRLLDTPESRAFPYQKLSA